MKLLSISALLTAMIIASSCNSKKPKEEAAVAGTVWSIEKAQEWGKSQPWYRGANFTPSTAINQLEFWQAETFDPETIDRELGWAEEIGFNCMRVYLHHLAWETDKEGFKKRLDQYLSIADKHGIKTVFCIFDDCWNPTYQAGKQPEPKPGIHNSGWVRDPGDLLYTNPGIISVLEEYVKDVMTTFKDDNRILLWDMYNEPGNSDYGNKSLPLLEKAFAWGREVNPSQPISSGVWSLRLSDLNAFQVKNSDVITYHNYSDIEEHKATIDSLKLLGRPMICTEYMARKNNSTFESIMPLLKENNIGAINWGLVAGKTNTIYAWSTPMPDGAEPTLWFHDIFRKDGSVYKQEEVDVIKSLTGAK